MSHRPGHRPAEHRIERHCDACGQIDNHPRHVTVKRDRHMDCCAEVGCDTCSGQLAKADGKQGDDLVGHLTGGRNG